MVSPIIAPTIPECTDEQIANAINHKFSLTSQSGPPLLVRELPSYLPAEKPPQVEMWEMYRELSKINARKAIGPDDVLNRLLKDFAFELSIPITDTFNSSMREGKRPQIWKDADVVPVPKESRLFSKS